jgi:hypothetical protein
MLSMLSDKELLETYKKSVEMKLELEFITLLKKEIKRRGLDTKLGEFIALFNWQS